MNTSSHKWTLMLVLIGLLAGTSFGQWKAGDPLPDLSGVQLSNPAPDLADQVVLLDFWASWCTPCKKSFPVLIDLHKKYAGQGLIVLAVSVDENPAQMDQFLKDNPVPFPVVRDTAQQLVEAAGIEAMPTSFLIDAQGVIRYVHTGFHAESTPEEYEEQIKELLALKSGGAP